MNKIKSFSKPMLSSLAIVTTALLAGCSGSDGGGGDVGTGAVCSGAGCVNLGIGSKLCNSGRGDSDVHTNCNGFQYSEGNWKYWYQPWPPRALLPDLHLIFPRWHLFDFNPRIWKNIRAWLCGTNTS